MSKITDEIWALDSQENHHLLPPDVRF